MNKILVTGCFGFISSHLVKYDSNFIVAINNFYSNLKEHLSSLVFFSSDRFNFIRAYIYNFNNLYPIIKENKINEIYHLVAIVSILKNLEYPILFIDVNIGKTLNILEASKQNKVQKIMFSSNEIVYRDYIHMIKDENSYIKLISLYELEKLVREQYVNLYIELRKSIINESLSDNSELLKILNYNQLTEIQDGIRRTLICY